MMLVMCADRAQTTAVLPGLVPGIHVHPFVRRDVDGRDKPGHDDMLGYVL